MQFLKRASRKLQEKTGIWAKAEGGEGSSRLEWGVGAFPRPREQPPTAHLAGTGTAVRLEQMGPGCGQ